MNKTIDNQKGFSLIELMIAIAIFGVIVAGIVAAFQDQLKSHNTQQRILNMQQNARAAMYYMTRELKMAGLNPSGSLDADEVGILTAEDGRIEFAMDFFGGEGDGIDNDDDGQADEGSNDEDENGNGLIDEPDEAEWYNGSIDDANEHITYYLDNDADFDGLCDGAFGENNDGTSCDLLRIGTTGQTPQVLATNIDALNFRYLGEDPTNNTCDINCPLPAPIQLNDIRSVQISLVARDGANIPVLAYQVRDSRIYYNQDRRIILPAQNDNFRRLFLSNEIRCRNLGLN